MAGPDPAIPSRTVRGEPVPHRFSWGGRVKPGHDEGEADHDEGEAGHDEGEAGHDEGEADPDEGEADPDGEEADPDEAEADPDEAEADPDEAEADPDEAEAAPDGDAEPGHDESGATIDITRSFGPPSASHTVMVASEKP
jgi:hypothetical protein